MRKKAYIMPLYATMETGNSRPREDVCHSAATMALPTASKVVLRGGVISNSTPIESAVGGASPSPAATLHRLLVVDS